MLHLDSWIKIDQLDVTCFIISLFNAQHVSNVSTSILRSLRLIVDLFHVLYCSGSMCVGVTVWFRWGGVVFLCSWSSASASDIKLVYLYSKGISNWKTELKVPFFLAPPAALKAKLFFIAVSDFTWLNLVSVGWLICCQKYVTACCEEKLCSLIADRTATRLSESCKCASGPRNTLNIMPVVNRI